MNTIELNEMTIADEKVLSKLVTFIGRVNLYKGFNEDMLLNVYTDAYGDFIALEARTYRIQFASVAHKLTELIDSGCMVKGNIRFKDLRSYIMSLYS